MAICRRCDMCQKIEMGDDFDDPKHCATCAMIWRQAQDDIRTEVFKQISAKFESFVAHQTCVVDLLTYAWENKRTEFERQFGSQGVELLQLALNVTGSDSVI